MSRTYRNSGKRFILKDRNPFMKKHANKVVRHTKDIPPRKQYRRIVNPWDISDWCFSIEELIELKEVFPKWWQSVFK